MTKQDRFKFRVWSVKRKEYHKLPTYNYIGGTFNLCSYEDDIIEQSTGLKDKNGKLIFESDIVEDKYGCKYIVKFGKHTVIIPVGYENGETECWGWYLSEHNSIYNLNPDDVYLIVGNIHENADLLENKDE